MTPFRVGHLEFRLAGELPQPLSLAAYVEHEWWQMAHVPTPMQADWGRQVRASYTRLTPYQGVRAQFALVNTEHYVDGQGRTRERRADGVARQRAANSALFSVSFTSQPEPAAAAAAYEIIGLASPNFELAQPYYSMSVVGEPTRRLLWVLCSQPSCSIDLLEACLELARRAGYSEHVLDWRAGQRNYYGPLAERNRLLRTPQTEQARALGQLPEDWSTGGGSRQWLQEIAKRPFPP